MKQKTNICCICGQVFIDEGNNPWPVKEEGVCCDECNCSKVVPARLRKWKEGATDEK